jgi:hypothetical protein
MIPDIEDILTDIRAGRISLDQALNWINQHLEMARAAGEVETLRDHFAAQALPAVIRSCAGDTRDSGETQEAMFARRSYEVADAMLAQRAARKES